MFLFAIYTLSILAADIPLVEAKQVLEVNVSSRHEVYQSSRGIAVSDSGGFAVLDRSERQVVLLDAHGQLVKRVGRRGQGPFEFGNPFYLCWDRYAGVYGVIDSGNSRLYTLREDGTFDKQFDLRQGLSEPHFLPGNRLFAIESKMGYMSKKPTLQRFDLNTKEYQTLVELEPRAKSSFVMASRPGGGRVFLSVPWGDLLVCGVGSDFIVLSPKGGPLLKVLDFNGAERGTVRVRMPRIPLTKAGALRSVSEHFRIPENKLQLPESWPALGRIFVDGKDRLWLFGPGLGKGLPWYFQVCDLKGNMLKEGRLKKLPALLHGDFMYHYGSEGEEEEWVLRKQELPL